jgi:hypothetical protein
MGEWRYSSTILDLGTRWRWVVCFTPLPVYLRYPLERRQGGPQSRSGYCVVETNLLPLSGIESRPLSPQPVAMPSVLTWLPIIKRTKPIMQMGHFCHLLMHRIHYMESNGLLRVLTIVRYASYTIYVVNGGVGIPEKWEDGFLDFGESYYTSR